jgi:hypothetical protein
MQVRNTEEGTKSGDCKCRLPREEGIPRGRESLIVLSIVERMSWFQ